MNKIRSALTALALALAGGAAHAAVTVPMSMVDDKGIGKQVGTVTISETPYGLVFTPAVKGLPPGLHGFHVHENPSCATNEKDGKPVAAGAAGGHYDPAKTGRHAEPWGAGHLGDLPGLYVDANGNASNPVLAPRLKLADIGKRALMIHAGGDTHADHPAALGGGGARMACGLLP